MEELDKRKKFIFPGYDGALPKALRSSRGRRTFPRKVNQAPDDLHFIELLATVAGQVLQAKGGYDGTQNSPGNEIGQENGEAGSYQTIEHFEGPNNTCGTIGKNSGKVRPQDFSTEAYLQSVKSGLFPNPIKPNLGSCSKEGKTFENSSRPQGDGSIHAIPFGVPKPGSYDIHMHSADHTESDANCNTLRNRDAKEEGSCMTLLRDNSPLPVSSGSSEEPPTHVHKQYFDQCRDQPLEGHLDCSQDLGRLKAKDDDDNFSNSVVPVTTSQQRLSVPMLPDGSQIQASSGEEASIAVTKRKGLFADDKNIGKMITSQESQRTKKRHTFGTVKQSGDPDKSSSLTPLDSDAKDASVASSPTTTSKGSWKSAKRKSKAAHEASPVKVNITSFRVPELSINLPESATIANLKKAVMEAAVNLLEDGLHVRVLHHGKKVYDENSTLVQMGISCKERLESLTFMLEPSGMSNTSMNIGESVIAYPKARSQTPYPKARSQTSTWFPSFTLSDDMDGSRRKAVNVVSGVHAKTSTSKNLEMGERSDTSNKVGPGLQLPLPCELFQPAGAALILHPGIEDKVPGDIMPAQQELGSSGGKRRTRRPFTVLEVEALVQAVELLGTGRWREVKQQVFSHARHRTYVDLKDKWKTLVHTARIAPQQRRGEPVPQELLDRVLQAHTYWAVQLAKQQEDLSI